MVIYSTNALSDSSEEKKMQLKLGFDFTQGENSAPSLRIRDFQDSSDFNHRAEDVDKKTAVRADSFSSSSESITKKDREIERSNERDQSNDKSDSDSDYSSRGISTRGLVPEEYEPEESPKKHPKYEAPSESDSERPFNRHNKRHVSLKGLLENIKRKGREFFDAERRRGASMQ